MAELKVVVVEKNPDQIQELTKRGIRHVAGDATDAQLAALSGYSEAMWKDSLVLEQMWFDGELDEYIDISSMEDHSALEVFESLGNAMIIELARDEDSGLMDLEFERIERNGRYRLRPLLVQPVIRSLRETNIVH